MSKVSNQHSTENGCSKTFTAPPHRSPEFGVQSDQRDAARGAVPGSPQWPVLNPDPELPS